MLAVVRRRIGIALPFRQRLHRAAERRPRLVDRHVVAAVDEVERSRESGQTAADDRGLHRQSPRATTASFAGAESRVRSPKTSQPLASIRSSVAS